MVQWSVVGTLAPFFFFLAAVALGSIPGQGTKIPQATQFRKKQTGMA